MKRRSISEHAKAFDEFYQDGGDPFGTIHQRLIVSDFHALRDSDIRTALDVGCSRGSVVIDLLIRGVEAFGTEISRHLLATDLRDIPVYPYAVQDLHVLPDKSADLVIAGNLLPCLRDDLEVDECAREIKRLAARRVVVTVGGVHPMHCVHRTNGEWEEYVDANIAPISRVKTDRGVLMMTCSLAEDE